MGARPDRDRLAVWTYVQAGEEIPHGDPSVTDAERSAAGRETIAARFQAPLPANLLREHARALADRLDPDRDGATNRRLDYYQHTAARADALIARQNRPGHAPADGSVPAAVPDLAGREQALAGVLLGQALEIFQRIGAAEAAEVSAELKALTEARPAEQGS
jgi:hypothetical protein